MFRYKWHVLVMLLLSMVGFSMVNAYTINVENRDPFGTLNLSTLMIKPNANSDSTIELSGNTLRIKTNQGKIKVHEICDDNENTCKAVQALIQSYDVSWSRYPIYDNNGHTGILVFPIDTTGSSIWIGKSGENLDYNTISQYKLRVVGKTRLEGDLLVTGGNITVYQICDENNNCKKVSELYTGNGGGGGGDTYWHIHTYEPADGGATVLFPDGSYNVWIGINGMPTVVNNYKLRVNGKTKLDGDLLVTGGNITVYEICDETGKCKKVSELYTGNGVGGGGGDVYWQLNGDILSTSGGSYGVNLNSNLNVAGSLNAGNLNTRGLNVTGNLNFAWENIDDGYNTVSTTKSSLHVGSSLKVAHDFTSDGTITAKGNIKVDKNDGKVNVYQICDTGGNNCRTVSQITTGNNYWKTTTDGTKNLRMSVNDYGLKLSVQSNNVFYPEYSFAISGQTAILAKLKISNGGVDLRGNTTLNNALTVKGNANLQSGLTVTGGTTLNNDLTVEGDSTLKNITSNGTTTLKGNLNVEEWAQFYNGLSIETGDLTVSGFTHLKSGLDVYKNANVYDGLNVSLKMGSLYQPVFRVYNWYGKPTITVEGVTDLRGDVAITGGKLTVNTVVSARTGTDHAQNMQPKVLSQIRLLPAGTGVWNPYENIMPDDYAKLEWYEPCQPDREGVIMYYREYNSASIVENRKLLGKFVGCVCDYKISSSTFDCEWEVIASK